MVTSHCQNCESPVSHAFVRVYGKNGRVRVCPECEIWERINRGAAAYELSTTSTGSTSDESSPQRRVTLDDLRSQNPNPFDRLDRPSPTAGRDRAFEQLVQD